MENQIFQKILEKEITGQNNIDYLIVTKVKVKSLLEKL